MDKYEEALERAKELHEAGNALTKSQMEIVFPELKESEDERIRKNCIHFIELQKAHHADTSEIDDCIAYLERQKEQKPEEWSEEDEGKLNSIYKILGHAADDKGFLASKRIIGDKEAIELQDFLKSLLPQPRQEWSEEDEEMLNSCISSIEESKENRYAYRENDGDTSYDREIAWLKSLRPQPNTVSVENATKFGNLEYERGVKDGIQSEKSRHWKPSEEQIVALRLSAEEAFDDAGDCNRYRRLKSLYDDLQKLL